MANKKKVKRQLPKNVLLKAGVFLAEKTGLDKPGKRNRELCQELIALAAGDPHGVKQYYGKKIADTLLVLIIFTAISLGIFLSTDSGGKAVESNQLERPGYGMGNREEELVIQIEGEEEQELLTVGIQEQKFTEGQVSQYLENGRNLLEQELLGENASPDEVRTNLYFPASLEAGAVTVSWLTFPYGMIDDTGVIIGEPEETGSIVEIQATLSCQNRELVYETAVRVYPPILTEKEQLIKAVQESVRKADEEEAHLEVLHLPEEVDGRKITWMEQPQELLSVFLFLTIFLPLCVYVQKDQKVHEKAKDRKLQMEMDYSDLMWKMTMLLGAGLTIRGAFTRIAVEYQREKKGAPRYVYEEMLYTCHEMKSGISEGTAYENFGRRCDLPKYIKLGSLLSQNLKKGSKGLTSLLEKEALSSMEERKNLARKLGEQAGTKLMFPMILMFAVVLIVLVVPAFLSF